MASTIDGFSQLSEAFGNIQDAVSRDEIASIDESVSMIIETMNIPSGGDMSDSTDFDEFEDFDFEDDIDLEQLETEEVVEKRRENRMLSMKDGIDTMKNLTAPETGTAKVGETNRRLPQSRPLPRHSPLCPSPKNPPTRAGRGNID